MRQRGFLTAVSILIVLLVSASFAFAKDAWAPVPPRWYVPGELLVGFHPHATLTNIHAAASSIGGKIKAQLNAPKGSVVRVKLPSTDPSAMEAAMNQLRSNPAVRYVEPNVVRRAFGERGQSGGVSVFSQSGDPLLWDQWGYYDIGAQLINAPATSTGVTVAVIDTGVDYTHPDLAGKVIKGYDYVNADTDPMDDYGHGTHVAGIIAAKANNNYGIAGVSWNTKILAMKVLDSTGYGNDYDVSLAIYAAANNSSVKVINMSLGGTYSVTEDDAVNYAISTKGKLVVAAAGNDDTSDPTNAYPAALTQYYQGILAVAAHDQAHCQAAEDQGDPFSNYGTWVSISAPGYQIISTVPPYLDPMASGFAVMDGTSMAAPHVSGAAALAWQQYPSYSNVQIANLITSTASTLDPLNADGTCWPSGTAFGRLHVLEMLEQEYYQVCDNKGTIYGYAFDAETGIALEGAKVTAKQGSKTTGINYVPYYGEITSLPDDSLSLAGLGLFNVLANIGTTTLTIQKSKYMTFTPKNQSGVAVTTPVTHCTGTLAGNIPVPPQKGAYWLVVTWDYGYTATTFDLDASVYDKNGTHIEDVYFNNPGDLNFSPYVKLLWDSYPYWFDSKVDPKTYAEPIRIGKITSGYNYLFLVADDQVVGSSSNWGPSGITAYLYKGSALVKIYTNPGGTGTYWYICKISGNTITDENSLTDTLPTP